MIREILVDCGSDTEKAAKLLGLSSRTLYRRFSKHDG